MVLIFVMLKLKNNINHLICLHIEGSQKWKGALPNLISREIIIIGENKELLNIENIENWRYVYKRLIF